MYLINKDIAIEALEDIKHTVWGHDIPHPGNCPEYRELHEKMQDIMKQIDEWKMKINSSRFCMVTENGDLIFDVYPEDNK